MPTRIPPRVSRQGGLFERQVNNALAQAYKEQPEMVGFILDAYATVQRRVQAEALAVEKWMMEEAGVPGGILGKGIEGQARFFTDPLWGERTLTGWPDTSRMLGKIYQQDRLGQLDRQLEGVTRAWRKKADKRTMEAIDEAILSGAEFAQIAAADLTDGSYLAMKNTILPQEAIERMAASLRSATSVYTTIKVPPALPDGQLPLAREAAIRQAMENARHLAKERGIPFVPPTEAELDAYIKRGTVLMGGLGDGLGAVGVSKGGTPLTDILDVAAYNARTGGALSHVRNRFGFTVEDFSVADTVASQAMGDALLQGVALGHNPRQVAREMVRAGGIPLNRALLISRTEQLRAFRESARHTWMQNEDVVEGWVWWCALDERSCASCIAQHRTEHPLEEQMATHPNCRCTMLPLIEDVDYGPTGQEIFDSYSDERQDKILGKLAGKRYRGGAHGASGRPMQVGDFVLTGHDRVWGPSSRKGGLSHAMWNAVNNTPGINYFSISKLRDLAPRALARVFEIETEKSGDANGLAPRWRQHIQLRATEALNNLNEIGLKIPPDHDGSDYGFESAGTWEFWQHRVVIRVGNSSASFGSIIPGQPYVNIHTEPVSAPFGLQADLSGLKSQGLQEWLARAGGTRSTIYHEIAHQFDNMAWWSRTYYGLSGDMGEDRFHPFRWFMRDNMEAQKQGFPDPEWMTSRTMGMYRELVEMYERGETPPGVSALEVEDMIQFYESTPRMGVAEMDRFIQAWYDSDVSKRIENWYNYNVSMIQDMQNNPWDWDIDKISSFAEKMGAEGLAIEDQAFGVGNFMIAKLQEMATYMTDPSEVWARSFAEWASHKAGDSESIAAIADMQFGEGLFRIIMDDSEIGEWATVTPEMTERDKREIFPLIEALLKEWRLW